MGIVAGNAGKPDPLEEFSPLSRPMSGRMRSSPLDKDQDCLRIAENVAVRRHRRDNHLFSVSFHALGASRGHRRSEKAAAPIEMKQLENYHT